MKKIIIGIACIMSIGLLAGTIYFEQSAKLPPPAVQPSVNEQNLQSSPQPEELQPIYEEDPLGYSLQNDQLQITYDRGSSWTEVPLEKEKLFQGEYRGSEQELIPNSYTLNEDRAAFLYTEDNDKNSKRVELLYSLDQGDTWKEAVVQEEYAPLRFRKLDFTSDSFGYVIISSDRTMSQEWTTVYTTSDGGDNWSQTNRPDTTRLIFDGGFVNENVGFLSYGTISPTEPDLYVTQDGGDSWKKSEVLVPEEYKKHFVMAEVPFKEDDHLAILIKQGPSGDYQGGHVKGKFISHDQGRTWEFSKEVDPNETIE
ncbi:WD40/YVTN/BNR-like repeat-containing protein [Halobacillus halophilus]|uniref:WD40/YVTN/BNR-like repeat-containing protein n=1 Tax=Halobacillus halophilus TaxID=1570 RepID=UPI001CD76AA1|nr:sialidase family protein [Halobacillus halophilus]MCA1011568.1 oxidoreductase [Halobacillus halophilus]